MYVRYHHDVVGVNSRLDSVQAAILSVKLPLLDFYNERRKEASLLYSNELNQNKNLLTPIVKNDCQSHVFHQYTLRVLSGNRDELSKFLNDNNIPHGIYYPIPLHKQKAYTDINYNEENFKISNMMSEQVISLPMHSELDNDQIKYICNKVKEFFKAQEN
jgi:dTDP-4-amino-4,6-dideoxygalactose transaminase